MRRISFAVLTLLIGTGASAGPSNVLTLEEAYEKALVRSESLAIQEETVRIAEAHYLQALGTVLPHLNVKATEIIQDTSGTASAGDGSISNTFVRRSRPEVAIQLSQPLFQGFREFRALGVSRSEKNRNTLQTERARQILFSDVARAYYTVLSIERTLAIQQAIRGTLAKRAGELKERINLGKSRPSELLSTESQFAASEADMEKTRGLVETARDFLGFLTGEKVTERLSDRFKVPGSLPRLETYVAQINRRPDLGASQESVRLAKGKLDYEKGGRYPTLDFDANYYPYRVGFQKDIKWDMTFTFNLPIFKGGATRGKIREAAALFKQSELSDQETNRQAELDVQQAYHGLRAAYARDSALRRAAAKAEATYNSQAEEYRLGLANNLEVLQSLRDWHEMRLESNQSYFETKLNYLQLLVAAGGVSLGPAEPDPRLNRGRDTALPPMTPHLPGDIQ